MTRVLVTGAPGAGRARSGARPSGRRAATWRWPIWSGPSPPRSSRPRFEILRLPPPRCGRSPAFRDRLRGLAERFDLIVPTCEEVFWLAAAAERDGWSDRLFAPSIGILRDASLEGGLPRARPRRRESRRRRPGRSPRRPMRSACRSLRPARPEARILPIRLEDDGRPRRRRRGRAAGLLRSGAGSPRSGWTGRSFASGRRFAAARSSPASSTARVLATAAPPLMRSKRSTRPAIVEMARRIAGPVGGDGQLSYDVIVRPDGRVAPIECNPRTVSGIHLLDGSPALARAILGRRRARPARGRDDPLPFARPWP